MKFKIVEKTAFRQHSNRFAQPADGARIFGADIDVTFLGADAMRRDEHSFNHPVWERFHQHPVHERAGIAFVAIDDDVFHAIF